MSDIESERRSAVRLRARGIQGDLFLDLDYEVRFVSTGGMMVRLPLAPEIGSAHAFSLDFGGRELDLRGVVRNFQAVVAEDGLPAYDVGIEFESLTDMDRSFLADFVTSRLTP
jgi:hypothetical protein